MPTSPQLSRFARTFRAALSANHLCNFFDLENGPREPSSSCGSEPVRASFPDSNSIERRPLPKKSKSCPLLLDIANMAPPQPPHWTLRALAIAT